MSEKNLADSFADLVNNFSFNPKTWCEKTWKNGMSVDAETFSALALEWLRFLGTVDEMWTDARNHASWELGQQLRDTLAGIHVDAVSVDTKAFCEYMVREHRTLQQSFTRLCMTWFYHIQNQKSDSEVRQNWIKIAKMIAANGTIGLPFI